MKAAAHAGTAASSARTAGVLSTTAAAAVNRDRARAMQGAAVTARETAMLSSGWPM